MASQSQSQSQSPTSDGLPSNFEAKIDDKTGRTYYINHDTKTTSFSHPKHTLLHEPYTPGVPYPWERKTDDKGRGYYINREMKTTSWMHPGKLEELKSIGILDGEKEEYGENGEEHWRNWMVGDIASGGSEEGTEYWVDYRTGKVDWQSPSDKKEARRKITEENAAAKDSATS